MNQKLSEEEKKQDRDALLSVYDQIKAHIGPHMFADVFYLAGMSILRLTDFSRDQGYLLKNRPIISNGKEIAGTCDGCSHRLTCITQDEGLCEDSYTLERTVVKRLKKDYALGIDGEVVNELVTKLGFQKKPVVDDIVVANVWIKDRLQITI